MRKFILVFIVLCSTTLLSNAADVKSRHDYADQLERALLERGLDASVRAVGDEATTLRISWAAMSRPVVYNMMKSAGIREQAPRLGFQRVVLTDDGSFSGASTGTWTYYWDGVVWTTKYVPSAREVERKKQLEARATEELKLRIRCDQFKHGDRSKMPASCGPMISNYDALKEKCRGFILGTSSSYRGSECLQLNASDYR